MKELAVTVDRRNPVDHEFRRRQIYGLVAVAVILLIAGLSRAAMQDVFPPGWWRIW